MLSEIRCHSPHSLAGAIKLLNELEDARIMAGGTDLLVEIKQGLLNAKHIISLQGIDELRGIERQANRIRVGSLVTPQEIISSSLVNQYIPALADAARSMAAFQIRTMATIGGNIASAVPSADLPPILIAADASIQLECLESPREVLLLEFFTGPRVTVCREEELLTSVFIPIPAFQTGMAYVKFGLREGNALAVASAASSITLKHGKIDRVNIVLGAVSPTPVLASKTSEFLQGKEPSLSLFEKAGSMAKEEGSPISDIRGSLWYRKELIQVLTRRALTEALARAKRRSGER